MIKRPFISSPVILLFILALLTYWLDLMTRPPEYIKDESLNLNPDYIVEELSGIRMDYERQIRRKFTAHKLFHFLDTEVTQLEQVSFVNVDPKNPLMRLYANRAEVMNKGEDVYLTGNVTAVRGAEEDNSNIKMITDFLHLIPKENFVKTNQPVTIVRFDTTIQAIGLEFDNRIGEVQLLSNVKAVNTK
ncbi:LPS export ABC transporter periplasmic protein LptC [Nitrosomonas sp.]|uniref:LPS export ABC transporter periplasmic protein LptC n=1 Tax=Nitrosomonas sp. TaxID=42353 RepID=UPI001D2DBC95|nr:LPS export ABC transporter periplasmic protein LptC [Nitrosomonas sp.]MBX3616782.1 LPS export ABC transporter periplasmic protein LptC [Nitrosomonas sp.]